MNNEESKKILNISLSKANLLEQKDRLVWPFSPDGQNQTRIAYQISLALTFTWKILREAIPSLSICPPPQEGILAEDSYVCAGATQTHLTTYLCIALSLK